MDVPSRMSVKAALETLLRAYVDDGWDLPGALFSRSDELLEARIVYLAYLAADDELSAAGLAALEWLEELERDRS